MIEIQIAINSELMSTKDLKRYLESRQIGHNSEVTLQIRKSPIRLRSVDPTILVALIGVVGAGIGSLLTGLLQIAQKSEEGKIIMQSSDGQRLEIPANTSPEEIDQLIVKLKKMNDDTIKVIIP